MSTHRGEGKYDTAQLVVMRLKKMKQTFKVQPWSKKVGINWSKKLSSTTRASFITSVLHLDRQYHRDMLQHFDGCSSSEKGQNCMRPVSENYGMTTHLPIQLRLCSSFYSGTTLLRLDSHHVPLSNKQIQLKRDKNSRRSRKSKRIWWGICTLSTKKSSRNASTHGNDAG